MSFQALKTITAIAALFIPVAAQAGDAVTLVFQQGQIVQSTYGFKRISEEFKQVSSSKDARRPIELNTEGGSFLLDLSQVVIVCRDDCPSLKIQDPRKTRTPNQ